MRFFLFALLTTLISCNLTHKKPSLNISKEKIELENKKDTVSIITSLLMQSEELGKQKEINKARKNINKAIKLSKIITNDIKVAESLFQLSKLEFNYGNPLIAELSLEKAKNIYKLKGKTIELIAINTFAIKLYRKLGKKEKVDEILKTQTVPNKGEN